jgi:hypothetical protein
MTMDEQRNVLQMVEERPITPVHPGSETLRRAVRGNVVSFPSQIPTLLKCPPADMQWRIVLLFFVRGWSSSKIAARFAVPRHRIWKILNGWSVRALALGYIQVIDPEAFEAYCGVEAEAAPAACELVEVAVAARGSSVTNVQDTVAVRVAALDLAIARCEAWQEEVEARTGALLRELRAAAEALATNPSLAPSQVRESDVQHGSRARKEEGFSHAVA